MVEQLGIDTGCNQWLRLWGTLPNQDCDHCVIRARYVAHKPGETTFYQCADVKVRRTSGNRAGRGSDVVQLLGLSDTNSGDTAGSEKNEDVQPLISQNPTDQALTSLVQASRILEKIQPLEKVLKLKDRLAESKAHTLTTEDKSAPGEKRIRRALRLINTSRTSHKSKLAPQDEADTVPTKQSQYLDEPAQLQERYQKDTGDNDAVAGNHQKMRDDVPKLYGMSNQADSPSGAVYYSINADTGERQMVGVLDFHVDSPFSPHLDRLTADNQTVNYVMDGVLTINPSKGMAVMPLNTYGDMDRTADRIVEIRSDNGRTESVYPVNEGRGTNLTSAFSAVVVEISDTFLTFNIEPANQTGTYVFVIGRLFSTGKWVELLRTDCCEDLYVNYQWAEFDLATKQLYVLLGNENDGINLTARLYKFTVPPNGPAIPSSYVTLDVSQFTFMSFHVNYQTTDQLYAISPGRHDGGALYPAYHLVLIDADTGKVSDVMQVTPPGICEHYYGGTVINGVDTLRHIILHVFRIAGTQADVIAEVDVVQKTVRFSQLTNLRHMHNLVLY